MTCLNFCAKIDWSAFEFWRDKWRTMFEFLRERILKNECKSLIFCIKRGYSSVFPSSISLLVARASKATRATLQGTIEQSCPTCNNFMTILAWIFKKSKCIFGIFQKEINIECSCKNSKKNLRLFVLLNFAKNV